jgi:hypothetical protein
MLRGFRTLSKPSSGLSLRGVSATPLEGRTFAYFDNVEVKDGVCIGIVNIIYIYDSYYIYMN